jgi:hypothetical protein
MFRKLVVFAITSGLAAKLYKSYSQRQRGGTLSQGSEGGNLRSGL